MPGDGRQGAGIVGTTMAGLDGRREMAAQQCVAGADLCNRSLDGLGHHQPRPFGVRSGLPVSSAQSNRGDDLIAKGFQLGAQARGAPRIVELNGFCELLAQLAEAAPVLLSGLGVELRASVAEVRGGAVRIDRCTLVAGCCTSRGEFAGQNLAARISQQVGDVVKALGVLEVEHVVQP